MDENEFEKPEVDKVSLINFISNILEKDVWFQEMVKKYDLNSESNVNKETQRIMRDLTIGGISEWKTEDFIDTE